MNIINLKQIRKAKGYTLSTLSSMTGCTSSYLSQLERGLKQPSLDMLRRISECLDVPIIELFSENETSCSPAKTMSNKKFDIIRHDSRKKIVIPEINTEYEYITPYSEDGSVNSRIIGMHILVMPEKWSSEKSVSFHFDFSIYIMEGTANVLLEENTYTLNKGDSIYIYSGIPHNFYNPGSTKLIMIGYREG